MILILSTFFRNCYMEVSKSMCEGGKRKEEWEGYRVFVGLVYCRFGVLRSSEAYAFISGIEYGIETFEESISIVEIES